jgi:glyoxylase-like metal-dependent hydrolase (beta-lactamase superfamily II)
VRHSTIHQVLDWLQNASVRVDEVGEDTFRLRIQTRGTHLLGFEVNAFLVGAILVDTGFAHVRDLVEFALADAGIRAICCTHSHEDHTGNCAMLQAIHDCPVYLHHPEALWEEGVRKLKPYRRFWWGPVAPFEPSAMPPAVEADGRRLTVVPTPGHSRTHVAFFEEATGDVYTGDLFVSPGATAVLIWGNPWDSVASLRRVAALRPRRMLTGHGLVVEDPASVLELKAKRIEDAARRAVELTAEGVPARSVVRRVFPKGAAKDRFFEWLTGGEFSRLNFVRTAVRHAPAR